jgi:hypothetical protein
MTRQIVEWIANYFSCFLIKHYLFSAYVSTNIEFVLGLHRNLNNLCLIPCILGLDFLLDKVVDIKFST